MKRYIILTSLLGLMAILPLDAQTKERQALDLQACLDLALGSNLSIQSGQVALAKAKSLEGSAYELAPTSISLSQDPTSGGNPDNGLSISQTFDFPTLYLAKRKQLKAETAVEQKTLSLTQQKVALEVRSTYYQLLYLARRQEILQNLGEIYSKSLHIATTRYHAGEASQLEKINMEQLYKEHLLRLRQEEQSYHKAVRQLSTLLGVDYEVVPKDTTLITLSDSKPSPTLSFEQSPEGALYSARLTASKRELSLSKQGYLPQLTLGLKHQLLIKGFDPYKIGREPFDKGNFMGFEVGISLPIFWSGQRAKVKAAKREVELSQLNQRQAERELKQTYDSHLRDYTLAQEALQYYAQEAHEQSQKLMKLSLISYELGDIDYVEYINSQKSALDLQLQHADAINNYNQALLSINYIQGRQ